ncbi:MAG TPA: DNA-deoxyinosine glycosylase [Clostridiaceae bacterium]|nr:DNA-deoxyinosine glycosylase [Clostridiaceae bacterium]
MTKHKTIIHPLEPYHDAHSKVLILGSFPSVKTRESQFFYGHPQNRFWPLMAELLHDAQPESVEEKRDFLAKHHIACWDVIYQCDIIGSSDSSIRNVVPTDLTPILAEAPIQEIFVNGRTAERYYKRFHQKVLRRPCIALPSTSPANAAWSIDDLKEKWQKVKDILLPSF